MVTFVVRLTRRVMTLPATRLVSVSFGLWANARAGHWRRALLRSGRLRASQQTSQDTQPQRK
jgi:hypothetical protein